MPNPFLMRRTQAADDRYSLKRALRRGGAAVRLSCLVMGLGNLLAGQIVKGLLFLAVQAGYLFFMLAEKGGLYQISMLRSLGDRPMQEIWNEQKGIYEYVMGDNSQLILLYGISVICLTGIVLAIWRASVCSGFKGLSRKREGKKPPTFREDLAALLDQNAHQALMIGPAAILLVFTVIPLFFMMSMAFTNYSKEGDHLILFDWVGLDNFAALFRADSPIGQQFGQVLAWTLVWAVLATFLNFILGTLIAMIINRRTTRFKGMWRGLFSLPIAVPQFVSLMIIYSMIQPDGIINRTIWNLGILTEGSRLPFLTDPLWARATVILVNLWVGIPYTILQVTGILKNIPAELYEAARMDGAGSLQQFRSITLPYLLFVAAPYLIAQFTTNVNNFNVIYLTTRGYPIGVGETAGATDLLVTWLYKLSVDRQQYNMAAVIGIFTFAVLSVVSLVTYRSTGSYKDEEGFHS